MRQKYKKQTNNPFFSAKIRINSRFHHIWSLAFLFIRMYLKQIKAFLPKRMFAYMLYIFIFSYLCFIQKGNE